MAPLILFVGGIRSGKTRLAEEWAKAVAPQCLMLATCHCQDNEMAVRIAAHQKKRGPAWHTLEEPLEPLAALRIFRQKHPDFHGAIVIDSLGMLISNLMGQNISLPAILRRCRLLANCLTIQDLPCAIVSEECNLGFVPVNSVARKYGDILGNANQFFAAAANTVIFASCGLPILIKGAFPRFSQE